MSAPPDVLVGIVRQDDGDGHGLVSVAARGGRIALTVYPDLWPARPAHVSWSPAKARAIVSAILLGVAEAEGTP